MNDYEPQEELGWGTVAVIMLCIVVFVSSVMGAMA